MSGAVVAAMVARARREIVQHFTHAGAVRPEHAVAFTPGKRRIERRMWERMQRFGAIREAGEGRYWLDEGKLADFRKESLARVLGAMAIGGLLAAGAIALGG